MHIGDITNHCKVMCSSYGTTGWNLHARRMQEIPTILRETRSIEDKTRNNLDVSRMDRSICRASLKHETLGISLKEGIVSCL